MTLAIEYRMNESRPLGIDKLSHLKAFVDQRKIVLSSIISLSKSFVETKLSIG